MSRLSKNRLDTRSDHQERIDSREDRQYTWSPLQVNRSQRCTAPELLSPSLDMHNQPDTVYKLLHSQSTLRLAHKLSAPRWPPRTANQPGSPCTTRHYLPSTSRLDNAEAPTMTEGSRNPLDTAHMQLQVSQSRNQPCMPPAHSWLSRRMTLPDRESSVPALR